MVRECPASRWSRCTARSCAICDALPAVVLSPLPNLSGTHNAKAILVAEELGCSSEMLILVSSLSVDSIFFTPGLKLSC